MPLVMSRKFSCMLSRAAMMLACGGSIVRSLARKSPLATRWASWLSSLGSAPSARSRLRLMT
ncbi:hypothetical protein PS706_05923 [Pseudomonas fluorescens]|nr:hypothetical protein PS706_05896 [Pseudomonas fluorescens]VVO41362.1 hypothetical protein PS706_05923 [Pseudomonas fluorescens]